MILFSGPKCRRSYLLRVGWNGIRQMPRRHSSPAVDSSDYECGLILPHTINDQLES